MRTLSERRANDYLNERDSESRLPLPLWIPITHHLGEEDLLPLPLARLRLSLPDLPTDWGQHTWVFLEQFKASKETSSMTCDSLKASLRLLFYFLFCCCPVTFHSACQFTKWSPQTSTLPAAALTNSGPLLMRQCHWNVFCLKCVHQILTAWMNCVAQNIAMWALGFNWLKRRCFRAASAHQTSATQTLCPKKTTSKDDLCPVALRKLSEASVRIYGHVVINYSRVPVM